MVEMNSDMVRAIQERDERARGRLLDSSSRERGTMRTGL